MDKSSSAFRTISEVASELDIPKHVLRFWEGKFNQLRPMKRGGGRRYYRPEDVELLKGIRWLLYSDGYTIKGVQRILRDNGVRFVKECWRGGAASGGKPASAPPDIPNLAAEAAEKARRAPVGGTRSAAKSPDEIHILAVTEDSFTLSQRAFLATVLNELEACRDILLAARPGRDADA